MPPTPPPDPANEPIMIRAPILVFMDAQPGQFSGTHSVTHQPVTVPIVMVSLGLDKYVQTNSFLLDDAARMVCGIVSSMARLGSPWAARLVGAHNEFMEMVQQDAAEAAKEEDDGEGWKNGSPEGEELDDEEEEFSGPP